jgi:PAS domain S-box-containing protein
VKGDTSLGRREPSIGYAARILRTARRWLIEPAPSVQGVAQRHRARLLASLLLGVTLAVAINIVYSSLIGSFSPVFLAVFAFLATAYGVSRTRHYTVASVLALLILSAPSLALMLGETDFSETAVRSHMIWLALPIVLGSLLLPIRGMIVFAAVNLIGMLFLPVLMPGMSMRSMVGSLGFILTTSALVIIAMYYRNQIEKERQSELRESEARWRSLTESSPDHVVTLDTDLNIQFVNYPSPGLKVEELIGTPLYTYVAEERQLEVKGILESVLKTGEPASYETRYDSPDGSVICYESRVVPRVLLGETIGLTVNARDITERKRAEAELLRLQHLLQNVTDSMPSALITLDPDGRVLTWNPVAETMTELPAAQVEGRLLWDACPEFARYRDLVEQVMRERRVVHQRREQLHKGEGTAYRDVSVFPLEADELEGVVLRIDDVTRRVQLEEMMVQSAKMASVGGLAAGVAHEINNPLSAMMQGAQVLQTALDTEQEVTRERLEACGVAPAKLECYVRERSLMEYVKGIRETGARAAKIVADLLAFSRKSSSGFVPCDLNELVMQTLELAGTEYDLASRYDFRHVQVERELGELPEVVCDGQQVQQVVLNLIRNAAQAMAEKRRAQGKKYHPRLAVRTSASDGWVRLEVEDNGPGIPPAIEGRLFEPFFTTKGIGVGTGLGLWLCWSIVVERHKGRIWSEQGMEGGARFVVELPLHLKSRDSLKRMKAD